MSEAYAPSAEPGGEDSEVPELEREEAPEGQDEGRQAGDEDEDEDKPRKVADDWEKKAHNQAGRAARERSRRVAAEKRTADLEARLERIEQQSGGGAERDELLELIGGLPETEDDPVGDIARLKKTLRLYAQRQAQDGQQTAQQRAVERHVEAMKGAMIDAETDFSADYPDYPDAAKFYRQNRVEELQEAGYRGQNLDRKLADDLFGVVRMAMEAGLDPAERVYQLAKRRGFKSGAKAADAKLDAIRRGQESSVRPQGRPAAGVLSWGDVAKLDGAARDKAFAKLREREKARK